MLRPTRKLVSDFSCREEEEGRTWLTAGTIVVSFNSISRFFTLKFETLHSRYQPSSNHPESDVPDRSDLSSVEQLLHLTPRLDERRGLAVRDGLACFGIVALGPMHELRYR